MSTRERGEHREGQLLEKCLYTRHLSNIPDEGESSRSGGVILGTSSGQVIPRENDHQDRDQGSSQVKPSW